MVIKTFVIHLLQLNKLKRLQLLLLAALALPTAVNSEPIPKISDYELLSTKGERFEFLCPKERYKQDGKIKKRKLYKECWFELNKDHMNFMDMQKIKREDIFAYWHFKSPHFNNTIVEHFLYYRFNGEIKKIIIHSKQKNFRPPFESQHKKIQEAITVWINQ